MKKGVILLIGILISVVAYFVYGYFGAIKNMQVHTLNYYSTSKQYLWLFKDSIKEGISKDMQLSWVNSRDIYNHNDYKRKYFIEIWEFKGMDLVNI